MEQAHKQVIEELIDLLHNNNLSEIEYEVSGLKLRVATGHQVAQSAAQVTSNPVVTDVVKSENTINSPMVGVVYLSANPDSEPFVKVGDMVHAGQVVCQIEAMKTFNPIKSNKTGKITKILVETGNPVEYDQPLFVVE